MYVVDFFKRITKKSNIPTFVYLVLNVFFIGGVIQFLLSDSNVSYFKSFIYGIILYGISLTIALSPIGEYLLRLQTGCRKIKRVEQINFLDPIFREVYDKAKKLDPSIPDDVQLFINDDEAPNAFATGRRTICVTKGLLNMPVEQIKATLGHEFGHLAHKDTDLILIVTIGNMIVTALITFVKIMIVFLQIVIAAITDGDIGSAIAGLLSTVFVNIFMAIWTKIGTILVMKSSRSNEFEADEFSFNLGYGDGLCQLLETLDGSGAKGLFATLVSTHPASDDRIAHLQGLGSDYRNDQMPYVVSNENNVSNQQIEEAYTNNYSNDESYDSNVVEEKEPLSNMIKCENCGEMIEDDSNFCPNCGKEVIKKIRVYCPNCGVEVEEEDAVYCIECGSKLN